MKKSDATRARILDVALTRFRKQGVTATTMRDIADDAGLSPGAAYYYFPSKESILLAYYTQKEAEHHALALPQLEREQGLRARLGIVMHTKLDVIRRERKLLGDIVQRLADPADEVSAFASETRSVRDEAIAMFDHALDGADLPPPLRRLLAPSLWFLHLGLLLYFVHDKSPGQAKTRRLVDDTLDLMIPLVALGAQPMSTPLIDAIGATLTRAGLAKL
jgi:AcrR family transcriptional regulator